MRNILGLVIIIVAACFLGATTPIYSLSSPTAAPTSTACTGQNSPIMTLISKSQSLIHTIKWSPDGARLATTGSSALNIWNTTTWKLQIMIPDTEAVGVSWSPDSKLLATTRGGEREHLLIWDAATGKLLHDFYRPPYNDSAMVVIFQVAWSPNGKIIATSKSDGGILLWDAATGASKAIEKARYTGVAQVSWSPDSTQLVVGGAIWNVITGEKQQSLRGGGWVAWSPTSSRVAMLAQDSHSANVWDAASGKLITTLVGHTENITSVDHDFSEKG